ncbi:MAG: hypothetical protein VST71_05240 [Nitrospirota bacterium]|nr:hypothetical protein [Nitrospirota bacterium]
MDTDDLSEEAFRIIKRAIQISPFLETELGALSGKYKNEEDYLKGMKDFIQDIIDDPVSFQDSWMLEAPLEHDKLIWLRGYIEKVMEIPIKDRTIRNC